MTYDGQVGGAAHGAVVRTSVAEAGHGGSQPASDGGFPWVKASAAVRLNPAAALVSTALGNWLPLVGSGDVTPEEALDNAAEEYIAEATAQGYIDG